MGDLLPGVIDEWRRAQDSLEATARDSAIAFPAPGFGSHWVESGASVSHGRPEIARNTGRFQWAGQDSNLGATDYESAALTN